MSRVDSFRGSAAVARFRRGISSEARPWQLRWKPVCASTELVLSGWLRERPLQANQTRAVLAARQSYGVGQMGKNWSAPQGGVWISAAMPWNGGKAFPGVLGLAVAVALSERLESFGVPVLIKWPNDLIVRGKKIAGLLPRLVHRGDRVLLARVGIGLNVCNRVPLEGIALTEVLRPGQCDPASWAAEVLFALDRTMDLVQKADLVCKEAERRIWADNFIDPDTGQVWDIDGLDIDGALLLRRGVETKKQRRWR